MENKYLVEESLSIVPNDIIQDIDWRDNGNLGANKSRPDINFWLENPTDICSMVLSVNGAEPQKINFEWVGITYGERTYFQCECGLRVSKLYLPPNGNAFKCRGCHNLRYFLTTINKNSIAGKQFYKMNRFQKLADNRANISRIFYKGDFTQRFERFLKLCDRAGYDSIVRGANDLRTLIKG